MIHQGISSSVRSEPSCCNHPKASSQTRPTGCRTASPGAPQPRQVDTVSTVSAVIEKSKRREGRSRELCSVTSSLGPSVSYVCSLPHRSLGLTVYKGEKADWLCSWSGEMCHEILTQSCIQERQAFHRVPHRVLHSPT